MSELQSVEYLQLLVLLYAYYAALTTLTINSHRSAPNPSTNTIRGPYPTMVEHEGSTPTMVVQVPLFSPFFLNSNDKKMMKFMTISEMNR